MLNPRWWSTALSFAACAAVSPVRAGGQSPQASVSRRADVGRLLGVYGEDSGQPVEGVQILDIVTGSSSLTSSTGTVSLGYLPAGRTMIRIQKIGYQPVTMAVTIGASDTLPITVLLQRLAQLPAVTTKAATTKYRSPGLRGFEERRNEGFGYFIADSTLRANESSTVAALVSRIPSISVESRGRARQALSTRAMSNGKLCPVDLYLDGVLVYSTAMPGGTPSTVLGDTSVLRMLKAPPASRSVPTGVSLALQMASDLNQFSVSDLAGIEYHNVADMPIEAAHTSGGCGALFLWTRER